MPGHLRAYQPPASHDNIVNLSTRAAGVELLCTVPFLPVVDPLAQSDWLDTSGEGRIDDPPTAARSGVDSHKDSRVVVLLDRRPGPPGGLGRLDAAAWRSAGRGGPAPCATGRPARSVHAGLSDADLGPQYFDHPGPTPTRRPISVRPPPCSGRTRWVRWSPLWPGPGCARTGWSSTLSAEVDYRGVLVGGRTGRCCLAVDDQDLVVQLALEASRPVG